MSSEALIWKYSAFKIKIHKILKSQIYSLRENRPSYKTTIWQLYQD